MGAGATGQAGATNYRALGKRISAKIVLPGSVNMGTASLQIYGMTLDEMNALAKTGWTALSVRKNYVTVEAGDEENGMSNIFQGQIAYAWPDMTNQPQVVFRVEAQGGMLDAVKPAEPTSFKGPTKFETAAKAIVKKFDVPRQLEMFGDVASKVLNSPYFYGSARQQFHFLAKAARVSWVDENEKTIAAWPVGGSRDSGGNFLISRETGMVADPIGTPQGILVKQLFSRPYPLGAKVQVKSIIEPANGLWSINRAEYTLESETPHGEWFVTLDAYGVER